MKKVKDKIIFYSILSKATRIVHRTFICSSCVSCRAKLFKRHCYTTIQWVRMVSHESTCVRFSLKHAFPSFVRWRCQMEPNVNVVMLEQFSSVWLATRSRQHTYKQTHGTRTHAHLIRVCSTNQFHQIMQIKTKVSLLHLYTFSNFTFILFVCLW